MDTSKQLYEIDATGWRRGLYDDIKATFRAPFVNWIFRTATANEPEFVRYLWGQVKPLFDTRGFAQYSVEYRDAVLSAIEAENDLPRYRREDLDLAPSAYHTLVGQLATFDVVAPRLTVLFAVVDRSMSDTAVGAEPGDSYASTAPYPDHLDEQRGCPPTMVGFDDIPDELSETLSDIREFHSLDEGLPSIYRCLAQWPDYLDVAWDDLAPVVRSGAFETAANTARARVTSFVESVPYEPHLSPTAIREAGFEDEIVDAMGGLFQQFNRDLADTIGPMLPLYAATVGAEGRRRLD